MSIKHEKSDNRSLFSHDKEYLNKLSRVLHSLWVSNKLCDVHLYVEGARYVAHKLIVIANCKSIRAKALCTKPHDIVEVHLSQSTKQGIAQTLSYLYTSEVHIHVFNFADILITSHELGVEELFKKCELFVEEYLKSMGESDHHDLSSFGRSLLLLETIREKAVYKNIMKYVASNFDYFMETDEFLDLNVDILYSFLACYDIVVKTELELLYGILKWLNKCPDERRRYRKALLVRINFQCIEPDKLKKCGLSDRLMKIPEIRRKVTESYSVFNGKKSSKIASQTKKPSEKASIGSDGKKESIGSQKSKKSDDSEADVPEGSHKAVEIDEPQSEDKNNDDGDDDDDVTKEEVAEVGSSQSEAEAGPEEEDLVEKKGFFKRKAHKIKKIAKSVGKSISDVFSNGDEES